MTVYTLTGHQTVDASADPVADGDGFNMSGPANLATGHDGYDDFVVNGADNTVHAGLGNDDVHHESGAGGVFDGGGGNDTMMGFAGDEMIGGDGQDFAVIDMSSSQVALNLDLQAFGQGGEFDLPGNTRLVDVEGLALGLGTGDDVVTVGDHGFAYVSGGVGGDSLTGGAGEDVLYGGAGHDTIHGGDGPDFLFGFGTDLYSIPAGPDVKNGDLLFGDGSNDWLVSSHGSDRLDGGDGSDTADFEFADSRGGVTAKLHAGGDGAARGDGHDVLTSIENLSGSAFGDLLVGDKGSNYLYGWTGGDTLVGGRGGDYLFGGDPDQDQTSFDQAHDYFIYRSVADSRPGDPDTVAQFEHGIDKINLQLIDADHDKSNGDTAFTFGDSLGARGSATLTFDGTYSHIEGDINGNGVADISILVQGQIDVGDIVV